MDMEKWLKNLDQKGSSLTKKHLRNILTNNKLMSSPIFDFFSCNVSSIVLEKWRKGDD